MKLQFRKIEYREAVDFLLPRHYSGRTPSISYAYGIFTEDNILKAVCTFGKPASASLCVGVCGKDYSKSVFELNRLCREDDLKIELSWFVSRCLKELKKDNLIIVSYSDTAMGHHGFIYQACNFIYTGATKKRTDKYTEGNKHSRHYDNDSQNGLRKVRSSKHRYVYFCSKNKVERKRMKQSLKYPIEEYPKGENNYYDLGDYLQPEIIKTK
jgi:hypothetical protein